VTTKRLERNISKTDGFGNFVQGPLIGNCNGSYSASDRCGKTATSGLLSQPKIYLSTDSSIYI